MSRFRTAFAVLLVAFLVTGCAPASVQNTSAPPVLPTQPAALPVTGSSPTPADTLVTPSTPEPPAATAAPASSGGLTWTIVPEQSEARYRVREQLVRRDLPNDAVGKTNQISGSITVSPEGLIDASSSKITVDVSTLATDERMRDNYVRRNILQTDQYPQVVFVPRSISGLPSPLPASGQVTFQVAGDLTIRGVTKPVTWDVTGTIDGSQAKGTATTSFKFEDFNLTQPQVPVVLSVDDKITLEADVTLRR